MPAPLLWHALASALLRNLAGASLQKKSTLCRYEHLQASKSGANVGSKASILAPDKHPSNGHKIKATITINKNDDNKLIK